MIDSDHNARVPVSIVAIGAGNRMRTYMHYVQQHPELVRLVAVVEPDDFRRNAMADQFQVPQGHRFRHYSEFFERPVPADGVIICTPESEHYVPSIMSLEHGYHILLEKPIAQTLDECLKIADAAHKAKRIVGICHVLRYHPCFIKLKELVSDGQLGKIISINHTENVGLDRTTHSYVRGTMNREHESNPMLLAKCCHDLDLLLWFVGSRPKRISSFGSLRWFRAENAPSGSASRCVDCQIEPNCPFSAINLYQQRRQWISNFNVPQGHTIDDVIDHELREGRYGRCVYHCENDVVDNQTLIVELEDGTTLMLTMDTFTLKENRTTRILLTEGEIYSDESSIHVKHFRTGKEEVYDFSHAIMEPYHAGADLRIVEEFVQNIRAHRDTITTSIDISIASHRLCFEGERSRLTGKTIDL